jgi:hypothetical protein
MNRLNSPAIASLFRGSGGGGSGRSLKRNSNFGPLPVLGGSNINSSGGIPPLMPLPASDDIMKMINPKDNVIRPSDTIIRPDGVSSMATDDTRMALPQGIPEPYYRDISEDIETSVRPDTYRTMGDTIESSIGRPATEISSTTETVMRIPRLSPEMSGSRFGSEMSSITDGPTPFKAFGREASKIKSNTEMQTYKSESSPMSEKTPFVERTSGIKYSETGSTNLKMLKRSDLRSSDRGLGQIKRGDLRTPERGLGDSGNIPARGSSRWTGDDLASGVEMKTVQNVANVLPNATGEIGDVGLPSATGEIGESALPSVADATVGEASIGEELVMAF